MEQSVRGAVAMEDIKRRVDALKGLGSDLGGGKSRIWIQVTDYTKRVTAQFPIHLTISHEC